MVFTFVVVEHDMRCKAPRISEIIRSRYHRDPFNGDVYIFMSKDCRKVKMIHFENHAYYLHEKSFTDGYRFIRLEFQDNVLVAHNKSENDGAGYILQQTR